MQHKVKLVYCLNSRPCLQVALICQFTHIIFDTFYYRARITYILLDQNISAWLPVPFSAYEPVGELFILKLKPNI